MRMPGMTGLELLHALKAKACTIPAIVITGHGDVPLAVEAMKAGAVDFIEKPFDQEAILNAVKAALERGGGVERGQRAAIEAKLASLSERERQVLEGLIAGHPNKTIAHDLGISPRTVEVYRANLMTKMEAGSLSELIRMAILAEVAPARRASK
jgi:two-component system response regulator FixJ